MILKSRFVVPVDAPVIRDGAVRIDGNRIAEVGSSKAISGASTVDYADAVICPGFVNAHTHLELTHLLGQVEPSPDFTGWLRRLMQAAIASPQTKELVVNAVDDGVRLSLSSGVTTVGDISRYPAWTRHALRQSLLRAVSFGEIVAVGNRRHLLDERVEAATKDQIASPRLTVGVTPHAPYTVEPDALRASARVATEGKLPMCIHLAETRDEERFTLSREGAFASYLRDVGVWDDAIPLAGLRPVPLAEKTGILSARCIAAHGNYVSDDDIGILAKHHTSVAYCPRTHHAFGHAPHRFPDMLEAGVNVCIGTDSLASNPSLSVLDELRFVHRQRPETPADELLALGTIRGARALGFGAACGSIAAGKAADLVVIPLDTRMGTPAWTHILDTDLAPSDVYVCGVRHRL